MGIIATITRTPIDPPEDGEDIVIKVSDPAWMKIKSVLGHPSIAGVVERRGEADIIAHLLGMGLNDWRSEHDAPPVEWLTKLYGTHGYTEVHKTLQFLKTIVRECRGVEGALYCAYKTERDIEDPLPASESSLPWSARKIDKWMHFMRTVKPVHSLLKAEFLMEKMLKELTARKGQTENWWIVFAVPMLRRAVKSSKKEKEGLQIFSQKEFNGMAGSCLEEIASPGFLSDHKGSNTWKFDGDELCNNVPKEDSLSRHAIALSIVSKATGLSYSAVKKRYEKHKKDLRSFWKVQIESDTYKNGGT